MEFPRQESSPDISWYCSVFFFFKYDGSDSDQIIVISPENGIPEELCFLSDLRAVVPVETLL